MKEILEEINSFGGVVRTHPLRSFKLMNQTISIGIIRDRERMQDDVTVFVNKKLYTTLYFPVTQ